MARTVLVFGDGMVPVALAAGLLGAGHPGSSGGYMLAARIGPFAVLVHACAPPLPVARFLRTLTVGPLARDLRALDAE